MDNSGIENAVRSYISRFGSPSIVFTIVEDSGLSVKIVTSRLVLESVQLEDVASLHEHLYGSKSVMLKYASGTAQTLDDTRKRVGRWVNRWKTGNPFAGLTARLSSSSRRIIGTVVLGGAEDPLAAELAAVIREDEWGKGYGTEIVGAVLLFYANEMRQRGYKLPNGRLCHKAVATVRPDNKASKNILINMGMTKYAEGKKFKRHREFYQFDLKELCIVHQKNERRRHIALAASALWSFASAVVSIRFLGRIVRKSKL
mmetsp:Transcript_22565/g.43935  ORF Transcript_22565/g.43935 Transcript_22565/m.43935 type:complete len:258 (-) Transcript_22565:255-1028(-)